MKPYLNGLLSFLKADKNLLKNQMFFQASNNLKRVVDVSKYKIEDSSFESPYIVKKFIYNIIFMLKLRLKRIGRKRSPSYRLVIMENTTRRDGRPIEEVGYYNPISKKYNFDNDKILKWLNYGVKPTPTVLNLLKKAEVLKS